MRWSRSGGGDASCAVGGEGVGLAMGWIVVIVAALLGSSSSCISVDAAIALLVAGLG